MEVETPLLIAYRLNYIERSSLESLLDKCAEVGRMLNGLMSALNRKLSTDHCFALEFSAVPVYLRRLYG